MFNELPLSGPDHPPTHTRWTFLLSLGGELIVLTVLLLIPLIYVQVLPFSWREIPILPPPPPTAPPHAAQASSHTRSWSGNRMTVPAFIPPHATIIHDTTVESPTPEMSGQGIPGAIPGNGNRWSSIFAASKPAPPAAKLAPSSPIPVGGDVQAAKLIRMVRPVYPAIAIEARIQGTVELAAIISANGTVESLRYLSGPPLLVRAAKDAVRQWVYHPTLLNGKPVAVETTIKVIFTLEGQGDGQPPGAPPSSALARGT